MARSGELSLDRLVTRFPFEQFDAAWSAAKTGRVIKPVPVTES
ncbi:hypothetical protein MMON44395_20280 [Mycolicibacterium monacense DSM 44395]|nr:hypothetical protein [Mycolicibacterium monacense DSM 44395]